MSDNKNIITACENCSKAYQQGYNDAFKLFQDELSKAAAMRPVQMIIPMDKMTDNKIPDMPDDEELATLLNFADMHDSGLVKELAAAVREAREENESLHAKFDLQHTRTVEAEKLWRGAHPGNDNVLPDLGDLLKWFIEETKHLTLSCEGVYQKNIKLELENAVLKKEIETWKNLANNGGENA